MNIAVAGTGYVGMSIATLLAQHNHVTAVDVIPEKVEKINKKISQRIIFSRPKRILVAQVKQKFIVRYCLLEHKNFITIVHKKQI